MPEFDFPLREKSSYPHLPALLFSTVPFNGTIFPA
jgi:hypothetical protein